MVGYDIVNGKETNVIRLGWDCEWCWLKEKKMQLL